MAIDFPSSPTLDQQFTSGGTSWIWDGSKWNLYAGASLVTQSQLSSTLASYAPSDGPTISGTATFSGDANFSVDATFSGNATFSNKPTMPGYQESLSGHPFVYENNNTITSNYTITTDKNASSCGTIKINDGITVSIPSGSSWCII
jgi:hypothetical protein